MNTKVLVVDDEKTSRNLFEMIIKESERYSLSGTISSASDVVGYIKKNPTDLILMDIVMRDGSNGIRATQKVKLSYPNIKVIIVTNTADPKHIKLAREAGADSFWYKEVGEEPVLNLMDRTMAGEQIFPDTTPELLLGNAPTTSFTEREIDVMRELAGGLSNKEIGEKLSISEETVKGYIKTLLDKTGYSNRTELAINAVLYKVVVAE